MKMNMNYCPWMLRFGYLITITFATIFCQSKVKANNVTNQVFGNIKEGIVAAFGDFNSDELTDVFLIRDHRQTLQILLGSDSEPLLSHGGPYCTYTDYVIISVLPGDFDGDAFMDVLVMVKPKDRYNVRDVYHIYIHWGGVDGLTCTPEMEKALIMTKGEPMAIDYNHDMIIDLYGLDESGHRVFWIFSKLRQSPERREQELPVELLIADEQTLDKQRKGMSIPNANAYLDLNEDFTADLFVQIGHKFEIWYGRQNTTVVEDFTYNHTIKLDIVGDNVIMGQALFADFDLDGIEDLLLPICFKQCTNSTILVYDGHRRISDIGNVSNPFHDIQVDFKDNHGDVWSFVKPQEDDAYLKTITAHSGDFNMDGYPDLLMTLTSLSKPQLIQTFLLENVPCTICKIPFKRSFEVKWNALNPLGNNTVAGAFYDFYQDGILDIILMEKLHNGDYRPLAFRNTLDYDANFVKVIVLTGLSYKRNGTNTNSTVTSTKKKRTYGTNLPGPRITYFTTTQDGYVQRGSSVQLPQSAYFALQLPYTIFGLGRTPNFVDSLTVGLSSKSRTWTQIIPNSQIIVVPKPIAEPQHWKAQLFVTPSKLILMSVIALGGTCLVIILIILVLYIKEKREDKQEKLQEAHRFHFDAM